MLQCKDAVSTYKSITAAKTKHIKKSNLIKMGLEIPWYES